MKKRSTDVLLYLLPVPVLVLSLFIGPSSAVDATQVLRWLTNGLCHWAMLPPDNPDLVRAVIWDIRLPRIVLTFLVGGSLACTGAGLQSLFRNPLVSPYILGLQSGAAFGAALALSTTWIPVHLSAFLFGILAVGISYYLARNGHCVSTVTLILAGIVVTGIFSALLTIVQFLSDPFKLQTIVHWTMGNLHTASWAKLKSYWWPMALGSAGLYLMRWRMNVLALGDDETIAVGLNPELQKFLVLVAGAMAASASVAAAGVVSMVGLVVPHMVRMMIGADNRSLIPAGFTFGGTFLLVVDNISRTAADFEIPIGIFTTLVGGPFFVFLLKRAKIGWEV